MVFFFFFVVFFATVVVVDLGAVITFGATVLFDEVGLANASVVVVVFNAAVVVGPAFTLFLLFITELGAVVAVNTVVGVAAFCGAVVCGIIGMAAFVGMGDMFNPVAYEVVGPMLIMFLLVVGTLAIVVVCGIIGMAALVGMGDMFNPVAYEEVGPAFTALLLMATFLVFSSSPSLSEPPQALMARRENAVKEATMIRGEIRMGYL